MSAWPTIEEFDGTGWSALLARSVERAQVEAIRATAGYLSALLTLELGKPTKGPTILSRSYAGVGAEGQPLTKSLESPRIGVLARLKEGSDSAEALQYGLDRAKRQVGMDFDAAHRSALLGAIHADDRFAGWQRATSGTCGACLGAAHGPEGGLMFPVHPGCQCVSEPVVSGVTNSYPSPTGAELFAAKSEAEQDEAVGPIAAQLLREEKIKLSQLVKHEQLDSDTATLITQRPVDQLVTATN